MEDNNRVDVIGWVHLEQRQQLEVVVLRRHDVLVAVVKVLLNDFQVKHRTRHEVMELLMVDNWDRQQQSPVLVLLLHWHLELFYKVNKSQQILPESSRYLEMNDDCTNKGEQNIV